MHPRRRLLVLTGMALLALLIFVIGSGSRGDKAQAKVELRFIGYTNQLVWTLSISNRPFRLTNLTTVPVFLASNAGSGTVQIVPRPRGWTFGTGRIVQAYDLDLTGDALRPGQTILVHSDIITDGKPFQSTLRFHPYNLRERWGEKLGSSTNALARALARRLRPSIPALESRPEWVEAPPLQPGSPNYDPLAPRLP